MIAVSVLSPGWLRLMHTFPAQQFPEGIHSTGQLEDLLSLPTEQVVKSLSRLTGDLLILGASGKMGPTLTRMAKRAFAASGAVGRVIAASRFSSPGVEEQLQSDGIETIRCDLLDRAQLNALPDAPNVVSMAAMKFGSTGHEGLTWAMNTHLAAMICQKFARSRIVAFSTGNIYGLSPVHLTGSRESDPLDPRGDYAASCLGRERMYEHFSRQRQTQVALIRLNYAVELRYGVLVDIARKVHAGEPVDVTMGHVNVIWQGDANAAALCAFDYVSSPPFVLNVTGPEVLSVRRVAEDFGKLLNRPVTIRGTEAPDALLSNAQSCHRLIGYPRITTPQMLEWIAAWIDRGGESLDKPTHFEARDGKY